MEDLNLIVFDYNLVSHPTLVLFFLINALYKMTALVLTTV